MSTGESKTESHNGSDTTYRVEIRAPYHPFTLPNGQIVTEHWRPAPFESVPNVRGNVAAPLAENLDQMTHTMSYYAAMAFAAGIMSHYPWKAETRLVRLKRKYSWTLEPEEGAEIVLEEAIMHHARASAPTGASHD